MNHHPSPTQALLLFGLIARHGECAQAELMPAISKTDREALAKVGMIAVEKRGRSFYLSLTDSGWDWAGANLSAELPSAHGTLHNMLCRLAEHLASSGETLAKFIGAKPAAMNTKAEQRKMPEPASTKKSAGKKALAKAGKTAGKAKPSAKKAAPASKTRTKAPSAAAVRKRIEEAYLNLTHGRRNETVRLAGLRDALGLDRKTVDAALGRILKGDKTASLMRHDDPNQLSQADHDAAFSPAGEPFHVIWIAS